MERTRLSSPLRGIIPPMVTPLLDPNTLDHDGLKRLIERMIAGGVHGLFVLGTTGEGPGLSYRLRREVIEATCKIVAGRVPVLVAITDTAIEECLALGDWAKRCGADAVVVAAPYYFAVSQNDLYRMIECLSTQLTLPLYIYNMPSLTKAFFEPETVVRASKLPNVYGIKDSSGDMEYIRAITTAFRERKDFTILVGPEELLMESMALGAHGGVNGGANLFPRLFVHLYEAIVASDLATVEALQQRVVELGQLLYHVGEPESSYLRGLKLGLDLMGICSAKMVLPFQAADSTHCEALKQKLNSFETL
ncbi:MAG: dihydrodipicolinate synthase family protein [Terracidiphilus sp.]|nr:dihydrodipicolinate synthase family protein [Terracidiphilus sp.]MDR3776197.1 dihydrodipicolinate synthase family protein [Terracidiphilus sp.]